MPSGVILQKYMYKYFFRIELRSDKTIALHEKTPTTLAHTFFALLSSREMITWESYKPVKTDRRVFGGAG